MRAASLLPLLVPVLATAAILRVPQDHAGVQAAMDASASGDTVLVERGTWTGLLVSPVHDLLLCSNYITTNDSTDIVETVLDAEYAGTLLEVRTAGDSLLTVRGLTLRRGYSRFLGWAYANTGGAVLMEGDANACFEDVVFADNRAERAVAVLFQNSVVGSGGLATGDLTLRRVHCLGSEIDGHAPEGWVSSESLMIRTMESRVIIDGLVYDGGGQPYRAIDIYSGLMDTLVFANVHVFNCDSSRVICGVYCRRPGASTISNVKLDGCFFDLQWPESALDSTSVVSGLELLGTGLSGRSLGCMSTSTQVLFDDVHLHDTRNGSDEATFSFLGRETWAPNEIRNLHVHDNVHGDSSVAQGLQPLVRLENCSLFDVHVHDNVGIVPGRADVSESGGYSAEDGAMVRVAFGDSLRFEHLLFEDNLLVDLDDYRTLHPENRPRPNRGRELTAYALDTLRVRDLVVRRSRQPNHCPEVVDSWGFATDPASTVILGADKLLEIQDLLLEDCDDGGLLFAADSTTIDRAVLRDVKRFGLFLGGGLDWHWIHSTLRNVWIDNTDAQDNWLPAFNFHNSFQAALLVGETVDRIELENVTVTNCDDLPFLFTNKSGGSDPGGGTEFTFRNVLLSGNQTETFIDGEPVLEWSHSLVPEPVPGEGNLIGLDPQFDAELGAPFLSPLSPCVDAGEPDPAYDDPEDPANPGFALWPSLGSVRSDIGFTGGPGVAALDIGWVPVVERPLPMRPAAPTLGAPWPNPFNPTARVAYELAVQSDVQLSVHDLLGRRVAVLAEGPRAAGRHEALVDGSGWASGLYFVTLEAAGRVETRKVLLVR